MAQDYQGEEDPRFVHRDLYTEDYDHPGGGSPFMEMEQESQVRHECQGCGQQVLPYDTLNHSHHCQRCAAERGTDPMNPVDRHILVSDLTQPGLTMFDPDPVAAIPAISLAPAIIGYLPTIQAIQALLSLQWRWEESSVRRTLAQSPIPQV